VEVRKVSVEFERATEDSERGHVDVADEGREEEKEREPRAS
jgi:hypothetical protein